MTRTNISIINNNGFIALTAAIIISGVLVLVAIMAGQLSIGRLQMISSRQQALESYYTAQACAEEALMRLKEDSKYSGNETISVDGRDCQILGIEGNWTIKTSANLFNKTKKIKVAIGQIDPEVVINSWEEVSDF